MDCVSIPIIIICSYIVGEVFKIIFKEKKEFYRMIPIVVTVFGGILGIIIFVTTPEVIKADNIWVALEFGMISGAGATSTNQIIKQVFGYSKSESK